MLRFKLFIVFIICDTGCLCGVGIKERPLSNREKSASLSSTDDKLKVRCDRLSRAVELGEIESIKNES